jgi:hypothetical protein
MIFRTKKRIRVGSKIGLRRKKYSIKITTTTHQSVNPIATAQVDSSLHSSSDHAKIESNPQLRPNHNQIESNIPFSTNEAHSEPSEYERRQAIAYVYTHILGSPLEEDWFGFDGTITQIVRLLNLKTGSRNVVKRVLFNIKDTIEKQKDDDENERKPRRNGPIETKIKPFSTEEEMVTRYLEQGVSLGMTAQLTNNFFESTNKEKTVTKSSIWRMMKRLDPVITKIRKKPQSNENHEIWKLARFNWVTQLLTRMGLYIPVESDFEDGKVPSWLDVNKLKQMEKVFDIAQVVHFDEVHKKQVIGLSTFSGEQIRFERDADGNLLHPSDFEKEVVLNEELMRTDVKFEKEGRFTFGVAKVKILNPDGSVTVEGRRCHVYDYSSKNMVNMGEWKAMIKSEILRVKNLPDDKCTLWKYNESREGRYFEEDEPVHIPQLGKTNSDKLKKMGITTIKQLGEADFLLQPNRPPTHALKNMPIKTLKKHILRAKSAIPGCIPTIDLRKEENPYEKKYGEQWETNIRKATSLNKTVPVSDLILHMERECDRIMKGTMFEGKGVYYHDALKQLTCDATVTWMKSRGLYDRWITPVLGCNSQLGRKKFKTYANRPVGNSPELMVLDNSLNKDVHECAKAHVAVTWHVKKEDKRKFSFANPSEISRTYKRIMHPETGGCPSSRRILEDVNLLIFSLHKIKEAKGGVMRSLVKREGRRKIVEQLAIDKDDEVAFPVNSPQPKMKWLHIDAQSVVADRTKNLIRDSKEN